ncbi:MAG TPA: DUF4260 domain-containing protein [bacterium]|jgi:hypothetical protein|nr:DUF4260 domain-containing protein [bacterium]
MAGVQPRLLLRVESFVITAGLLVLYGRAGGSWVLFFAAILVPDLSILGYAAGPHVGAAIYNLAHTYSLPVILAGYGLLGARVPAVYIAAIWLTHISVDRMLGLGLKYPTAFKDTHLNRV